jgi:adenylate cyclase
MSHPEKIISMVVDWILNYWWIFALIVFAGFWYLSFSFLLSLFKKRLLFRIRKEVRTEMEREYKLKHLHTESGQAQKASKPDATEPHQTYSRKYDHVTVLFADIQGFTKIVEHLNPEKLVDQLDHFFFKFDEIMEKYSIEKIKTIGDAYMCAGGLPEKNRTNPVEVVLAALEMQRFMKEEKLKADSSLNVWELRVGVHTGSVISGLVGRKKIAFDIWGDSVNIASRMESSGVAGEINITGVTYQYVRDFFVCQYRGKMPIKYKGEADMYFVTGIVPELSVDGMGIEPNEEFRIRLQHMRFADLEEFLLSRMSTELSETLYYHNVNHTVDVLTRAEVLGRGEGLSEGDLLLVKTAALLHDSGFLLGYQSHEDGSIELAKELLPRYKYSSVQIEAVVQLIDVTRINRVPNTLLAEIMKDADLDYLGRADYVVQAHNLYKELNGNGMFLSEEEWMQQQYDFMQNHKYYTATAKKLRQVNKGKQLEKMKLLLEVA